MKRTQPLLFLMFMGISMLFHSCSSTELNKLEGQWQLFWINDLGDGVLNTNSPQCNDNIYIWSFEEGQLNISLYQPPTPANPTPQAVLGAQLEYKTSAEFLDAVVEISGYTPSITHPCVIPMVSNGKWTIQKIDNEVMTLITTDQEGSGGSVVTREFTRVD
ncbi:MAG: hypothetical protein KDB98_01280 [Flavobacteriales bacterium]|nr:hypothetical protein [Flavobacteriales bacterium]